MYYRYEAQSFIKDINLALDEAYINSSFVFALVFGVLAFALCLFAAISMKQGRIYGVLVSLLQPLGLFASYKAVIAYSAVDFSSLVVKVTGTSQEDALTKLYEKVASNMLEYVFPQLGGCVIWSLVLGVVFFFTLIYMIVLMRAHAKGLAIFSTIVLILKAFLSPINLLAVLIGQVSQQGQMVWDFIFRIIFLFPLALIAFQGVLNILKRMKDKKQAARMASDGPMYYAPGQAPMYYAPGQAPMYYAPGQAPMYYAPTQAPMAQPVEQPVAQPAEQPVAQPAEQPAAQPVEQPAAQPVEQNDNNVQ